jgi:hypothetical protein
MSYTDTNLELSKNGDSKVIISHGINLLTEKESNPFTTTSTKYNPGKEIKISYGMQFEATDDYLNIYARNTSGIFRTINIPYGLNMGLSSTELSVYDDDEKKNIPFPKGLRMVTDGSNLRVWKPNTIINTNLKNQIQINYRFPTIAGSTVLLFHKPGDTIDANNNSLNQIQMPWGIMFGYNSTYLTIYKPGDSTKGVKLESQTL